MTGRRRQNRPPDTNITPVVRSAAPGVPPTMHRVPRSAPPREGTHPIPPPLDRLRFVGIDLDGCLAHSLPDRRKIGVPISRNIRKLREVKAAGYKVIIHTSRPWEELELIESYLKHYNIPYDNVQCGKPLYALYVDDRARHSEEESWLP